MELRTKYQYTYFIYPYVINEKKYDKYVLNLIKNRKCHIKIFEKEKDLNLYTYFLPQVREKLFWSLELGKSDLRKLEELEDDTKAAVLSNYPCMMFDYDLKEDIQGKIVEKERHFLSY